MALLKPKFPKGKPIVMLMFFTKFKASKLAGKRFSSKRTTTVSERFSESESSFPKISGRIFVCEIFPATSYN